MGYRPLLTLLITMAGASTSQARFEAHEWGTFTSVVGSNGKTQHGMYHEDEALPDFVHGFGEIQPEAVLPPIPRPFPLPSSGDGGCRNRKVCFSLETLDANPITQKMETPVIYFYTDKQRDVEVNVKFPEGIITETFPAPVRTYPRFEGAIANGDTTFKVHIGTNKFAKLLAVSSENIYSHARNVPDANIVSAGGNPKEEEKFIFYRGLGRFQPQMRITSDYFGTLTIDGTKTVRPTAAILIGKNFDGSFRALDLGDLTSKQIETISSHDIFFLQHGFMDNFNMPPVTLNREETRTTLLTALQKSGLYPDEASAMVNTWENGYLNVPGLRLLYVLPRNEVDSILPLTMTPAPDNLVRVFVGRLEILTAPMERSVLSDIRMNLDRADVDGLGRFAHAILIRTRDAYIEAQAGKSQNVDTGLLAIMQRLIDRAARNDSSDGSVN
jgi:hypothetical protein